MAIFFRSMGIAICGLMLATAARAETVQLLTGNYPPYEYEEDGQVKGMAIDIIREAFKRSDREVNIRVVPWARALQETQNGDADGVFAAVKTPERERVFTYSREVIVPLVVSFFVQKNSPVRHDGDLSRLANYRFGTVNQFSNGALFDDAVKAGVLKHVEVANDTDSNVKKLLAGRIDVMVNNRFGAYYFLEKNKVLDQVVELRPELDSSPSYLAFTKKRDVKKILEAFDAGLAAMKKDGSYQRIVGRYTR